MGGAAHRSQGGDHGLNGGGTRQNIDRQGEPAAGAVWRGMRDAYVLLRSGGIKRRISGHRVHAWQESVDDELVDIVYEPSCEDGALAAFVSILTGPPGPRPEQLVPSLRCPLLILWGRADTLTPADGPVGQFFQALPQQRPQTSFVFLDAGHCPHDDRPEVVNAELLPWLDALTAEIGRAHV